MRWLEVPAPLLRALGRKLPELRAEDALHQANIVAVGTGSLKDPDGVISSWQRAADGARRVPTSARERLAFAALRGIRIVEEKAVKP